MRRMLITPTRIKQRDIVKRGSSLGNSRTTHNDPSKVEKHWTNETHKIELHKLWSNIHIRKVSDKAWKISMKATQGFHESSPERWVIKKWIHTIILKVVPFLYLNALLKPTELAILPEKMMIEAVMRPTNQHMNSSKDLLKESRNRQMLIKTLSMKALE